MRKLINSFLLLLIIFCFCIVPVYARDWKIDEAVLGNNRWVVDSNGNLEAQGNYKITYHTNLLATGIANGDSTSMSSATTTVPITYKYVRKDVNSVNQTCTLANGFEGQMLTIYVYHVWDSGVMTLTPATRTGFRSLTFNAAGDFVTLLYINDTIGWVITALNSVTIVGN